jgi:hypothetical protein
MAEPTKADDATPSGADPAVTGVLNLNDPTLHYGRNEAMAAMRARRREKVLEDMDPESAKAFLEGAPAPEPAPAGDEDTDPEERKAEEERAKIEREAKEAEERERKAQASREQLERQTAVPKVLAGEDLEQIKVKIKVFGEEREVPVAELVRTAQKVEAADVYLEQAKGLKELLTAQQAAAKPTVAAAVPAAPVTAAPAEGQPQLVPEGVDAAVEEALELMFKGNTVDAKASLVKAIVAGAKPGAAPVIDDALIERKLREVTVKGELRRFAKTHADDIMAVPLRRIATDLALEKELESLGVKNLEDLAPEQVRDTLEKAGEAALAEFGIKRATPRPRASERAGSEANTLSDRRARKDLIDELPAAATRAGIMESAPKTPSDTIAAMKKARGQSNEPEARS